MCVFIHENAAFHLSNRMTEKKVKTVSGFTCGAYRELFVYFYCWSLAAAGSYYSCYSRTSIEQLTASFGAMKCFSLRLIEPHLHELCRIPHFKCSLKRSQLFECLTKNTNKLHRYIGCLSNHMFYSPINDN